MYARKAELALVDYIRPTTGPTPVVTNAATIRSEPVRGGRVALTRVVVASDAGAGGAFVALYSGTQSPDRLIDTQTVAPTGLAAIFEFTQPVVLQEWESLTAVITNLGATATNVYVTYWAQLLRPKSAVPIAKPDTESPGAVMRPWQGETDSPPSEDTEDSDRILRKPTPQEILT